MSGDQLTRALKYPRFRGTPRVLVFDTEYLTVRDVIDGARDLNWGVHALSTKREGLAEGDFVARLLKALAVHQPDFVLTINHLGFDEQGVLAELLSRYEIPVASWFVDHPLPILGGAKGNATPNIQLFSFERTSLSWLKSEGYADPVYLPTGSNRRYFHPDRVDPGLKEQLSSLLSFVGNSWWSKAREEPTARVKRAARELTRQLKVNKAAMANGFDEKLKKVRISAKDPRIRYIAAQVALAEASMDTRARFARALLPLRLRIHGDPHWAKIAPGIDLRPGLNPENELPALFAGTAVNVNVTAEQMPTAVNGRVWDVPGTLGFLLTDAQEDALEFFVESEDIALYRDFDEARDKAKFYLDHGEQRMAMARRAFEKIERSHRITHRLTRLFAVMRQRFG